MTTNQHLGRCRDYVRVQITENAITDGQITSDVVLIDTDTVWTIPVGDLIDEYLLDGTASCTCD